MSTLFHGESWGRPAERREPAAMEGTAGHFPKARIAATGEFLDSLSPEEAEVAARKLLALTIAYGAEDMTKSNATLDEFFERVDAIEKTLMN